MAAHPFVLLFPFVMVYAAAMDMLTMRIANYLSLGLAAAFFFLALIAGMPMQAVLMHLVAGVIVLAIGIVLFGLRLVGGGDAKLLVAAALWIGYDQLLPFLVAVTVFGGALALLLLAYRRMPAGALPLPNWAARLHQPKEGMPYGIAIAAGALAVYPLTGWAALLGA